jgi:hypothetical protein
MGVVSDAAPEIGHALGCQLAPRVLGSQFRTWSGRPAYPGSTLAAPGVRSGGGPGISIGGACGGGWGLPAAKNGGFCIKKRSGPDSIACVTRCGQPAACRHGRPQSDSCQPRNLIVVAHACCHARPMQALSPADRSPPAAGGGGGGGLLHV